MIVIYNRTVALFDDIELEHISSTSVVAIKETFNLKLKSILY